MKFLSKPQEVEAVQWTGTNREEIAAFCGILDAGHLHDGALSDCLEIFGQRYPIGDYVVKNALSFACVKRELFESLHSPVQPELILPDGAVDFHRTLAGYAAGLGIDPRFLAVNRLDQCDIVTILLAVEIQCPHVEDNTLEESIDYAREQLEINPITVTLAGEELFHYSHADLCVGEPEAPDL